MKRHPAPILNDYVQPRGVYGKDRDTWMRIGQWQREGLVTVKPTAKDAATVVLTEKGREAIAP
jgi:hypothetical protein